MPHLVKSRLSFCEACQSRSHGKRTQCERERALVGDAQVRSMCLAQWLPCVPTERAKAAHHMHKGRQCGEEEVPFCVVWVRLAGPDLLVFVQCIALVVFISSQTFQKTDLQLLLPWRFPCSSTTTRNDLTVK